LAEVAALSWDQDLAARLYDPLVPYAHLVAMAGGEPVGGSALRSLGKLATVMGRFDQAERHFEHALSVHEGMGANVCTARTNHDRAIMLARRGGPDDLERARELAGVVAEAARRLGVAALLPALVTLGLLPPDGATAGSEPAVAVLSPRETEIAALVAAGMSNREIAERLYLSERTVETHVGSILRKLACRS